MDVQTSTHKRDWNRWGVGKDEFSLSELLAAAPVHSQINPSGTLITETVEEDDGGSVPVHRRNSEWSRHLFTPSIIVARWILYSWRMKDHE